MLFTSLSSCFLLSLAKFALADSGLHVLGGSYEPPEVQALAQSVIDQFGKSTSAARPTPVAFNARFKSASAPTVAAKAASGSCNYWLENIKRQGIASFNTNPGSYQVFRNVKDFGAKGDGVTDDTSAINQAISSGNRCAPGSCASSSTQAALVYFPPGTYMISAPVIDYYYTMLVGNPNCLPSIKATANFAGFALIEADPYGSNGQLSYGSTNVFWRQIRNLIIDSTNMPAAAEAKGVHWPTGQATSIQNVVFQMSQAPNNQHQGLFIESGSGGFLGDLVFYGGLYAANIGNQQFTLRNASFYNANTAINQLWDWGWTYQGISINNCSVGLDMSSGGISAQSVASVTFIDSSISNTPVGIITAFGPGRQPPASGNLILENVALRNVPVAVQGANGTALAGTTGSTTITGWGQGHAYTPAGPVTFQGTINAVNRPSSLRQSSGAYYARSKPLYQDFPATKFVSARTKGAKGDGKTDDTAALQKAINDAQKAGYILFVPHGNYIVTKTIVIPAGSKIVGEAFSVILSKGSFFDSMSKPQPVVRIGSSGQTGSIEWQDMIVSTQGRQRGATLIEYNLKSSSSSPSGLWDVHTRIGGFAGSNLQYSQCPSTPRTKITSSNLKTSCIAAFMSMHITKAATGLYLENVWLWVADHDVEDPQLRQITVYAGRGLLDESSNGPIWMVGTSVEHHTLYQYHFTSAKNVYAGQIQTETAYYQPNPPASIPFPYVRALNDPRFLTTVNATYEANDRAFEVPQVNGWGLRIQNSANINIYGAGLYSFFDNYSTDCSSLSASGAEICQTANMQVAGSATSSVTVYNLNTVGAYYQVSLNGQNSAIWSENQAGFTQGIALFRTRP